MNDRLIDLVKRLIASQGRDGDTMLAHINTREAAMLKAAGGSGTINPKTGLPEFSDGSGGGFGGSATGAPGASVDAGLGSANSNTMGGFAPGGIGALSNPTTGYDAVNTMPSTPKDLPTGFEKLAGMAGGALVSGIAGLAAPGAGIGVSALSGASGLTGGQTISGAIAQALADRFGGTPQAASLSNQGGINLGAAVGSAAPQPGQSSGLDEFLSSYLRPPTATATPQTPTPEQQALAARGFYTTPSTMAPTSAIDPVLQSAMLYARG